MFKSFRFFKKVLKETALNPFCFQRLQTIFKKEFFQILFCPLNERECIGTYRKRANLYDAF